jgi:hypothetical protein
MNARVRVKREIKARRLHREPTSLVLRDLMLLYYAYYDDCMIQRSKLRTSLFHLQFSFSLFQALHITIVSILTTLNHLKYKTINIFLDHQILNF